MYKMTKYVPCMKEKPHTLGQLPFDSDKYILHMYYCV